MKKILIGTILLMYGLNANSIEWKKNIPKNYQIADNFKIDFNRDGMEDILLHLFSTNEKKEKIIVLEAKNNNKYFRLLESDNVFKYPSRNGQGYMIRDISINSLGENIIVSTSEYQGVNISRDFYFKFKEDNFYLYKYSESYGTSCNNYTIGKSRINDNIKFILKLKDFSVELFFKKYYDLTIFQLNLKRQILANFESDYSTLLKKFRKKDSKELNNSIKKILVHTDNEKICEPYKYLDMYLYLNQKNTIAKSNDIAFFFDQAGYHKEAVYLLEKIITKYPKRMVAYYNLGDAYWALGDKKKARKAYTTYTEQMCDAGKQKRIPKIVKDRVSGK